MKLFNWKIEKLDKTEECDAAYVAFGNVTGHLDLKDGERIHTSFIKSIEKIHEGAVITTYTNHCYELDYMDLDEDFLDKTRIYLQEFNMELDTEQWKKQKEDWQKALMEGLEVLLEPGELYLKMIGITVLCAFFRNTGGNILRQKLNCNMGTVGDSCVVSGTEADFNFLPWNTGIEAYHWNECLKKVKIENVGEQDFDFWHDKDEKKIRDIYRHGEITEILL